MSDRAVIFVVGMPRSGTSALTRVLSLSVCTLPRSILAARELNPTGFWEPVDAVKLNHEFLFRHYNASVDQLINLSERIECDDADALQFTQRIEAFLSEYPEEPILLIKELDI